MTVTGDAAKNWDAVRLDSCEAVNSGTLIEANEEPGFVSWKDRAEQTRTVTLGTHMIKLIPKSRLGR